MLKRSLLTAAAAVLAFSATPAMAQIQPGVGKKAGDFMVRLRGTLVAPSETATVKPIGGKAQVENDFIPEVDFSYFITDNIAVELIAGTSKHKVKSTGSALGADLPLGSVRLLPPTLTLQYHFLTKEMFSPYVGAGINYTLFYNEKTPGGSSPVKSIDYENRFGFALQAGLDIQIDKNWYVNLDVKKIWLGTDVKIGTTIGAVSADVDLDPWVASFGIGYKF